MSSRSDPGPPGTTPGQRLVTVATFREEWEAYLAKGRLEEEGIEACVADGVVITVNWLWSNAMGGVKLQVREEDAERALHVLRASPGPAESDDQEAEAPAVTEGAPPSALEGPACPRCGSRDAYRAKLPSAVAMLSIVLLGFPLLFLKRRWVCGKCGHQWKRA